MSRTVSRVSVVGAGAMGAGIAQVAAQAGAKVVVSDLSQEALDRGRESVVRSLNELVRRGRVTEAESWEAAGRIAWVLELDEHAGAELLVEAVAEDLAVKSAIFRDLERIVAPEAILATNTSSLPVTALAAGLRRPERFAGMHFFNPAPVMRLVEVVSGARTAPETAARVFEAALAWGKAPIHVRDVPGFVVNRVARPYYGEGLRAWNEGVGAPAAIDHAFKALAGFRMGPLELADLIGHDVNSAVAQSIYAAYFGRTRFAPQLAQIELVAAGRLGRKTGAGVYEYGDEAPRPKLEPEGRPPAKVGVGEGDAPPLLGLVREAGLEVETTEGLPAGALLADGVLIAQADGRSAALRSAEAGVPVAALDWARDPAASSIIAFSASDETARAAAAGLAAALGVRALRLTDRPGGLVLRTLAQLANSAADAVRDRVAAPADIDRALVFGANYPQGPLAWADEVGVGFVVEVLERIAFETGEEMYRPSEVLRRAAATSRPLVEAE